MSNNAPTKSQSASKADPLARRKGRQQRIAAEKGKTLGFYIKEIAAKGLNPKKKSAHFAR